MTNDLMTTSGLTIDHSPPMHRGTIHHTTILFDGVCNLCSWAVQFVIRHDKKSIFKFASLQGEHGQQLLNHYQLGQNDLNSFVLIQEGKAYTKSKAALLVAKKLAFPVNFLYGFIIVPRFISDAVYEMIAKNRYRWFGKKEECMVPTPALKERFLK